MTDALSLAADASATLVVVEAGRTSATEAARVIDSLRAVGANVVGVVLNKARNTKASGYYYRYADDSRHAPGEGKARQVVSAAVTTALNDSTMTLPINEASGDGASSTIARTEQ